MNDSGTFTERRQHKRAHVQNIVLGILNSEEPELIGSIDDISIGGIRYTYNKFNMSPNDNPIQSIDLIAEDHFIFDIPCRYAWNVGTKKDLHSKVTNLRKCGIQFGKLTPNQIYLLKSFMNRYTTIFEGGGQKLKTYFF